MNNDVLDQGLSYRQSKIQTTRDYLQRTQALFDLFGSNELKTSHAKFAELAKALESDSQVLLVVIGEFSRGKSSLVNALLGIHLLRSAQEATTAINTFIKALPADRTERFIRIHFQDGRPHQEILWTDEAVLERWGTELDSSNADARKTVDYIEIFTPHPLLEKGLVLIDTPGLQSVVQHHEEITRKAIAEAHIAIWVQSTQQLGGNATEWAFLAQTIRKNFRKFITVVNMWDAVLEPTDPQEKGKMESVRVREKMDKVKRNFRDNLAGQPESELELLTNSDHLMGVSAIWALGDDAAKKERSGVGRLAERISDMFTSGEALEQIYLKPLTQLSNIQDQLAGGIEDELTQLASTESLEERQKDLALFDEEIKNLELEMRTESTESKREHERAAKVLSDAVEKQLVAPLAELKSEIELQVSARHVETMIARKVKKIGLPEELQRDFEAVSVRVGQQWDQQKQNLSESLEGLRADYADRMKKHANQLKAGLGKVDVSLPSLDVGFDLDLTAIEDYHSKALELEQAIQAREQEIENLETEKASHAVNAAQLQMAQQAVARAERSMDTLGPQPAPRIGTRREKVSNGGMYSSAKYETQEYRDDSNVQSWKEEMSRQQSIMADKEARLADIIAEEQHKTGMRLSLEAAQRKYAKELEIFNQKKAKYEQEMALERKSVIEETLRKLIASTAGQLDQRIRYLQDHAKDAIQQVFASHMELLEACVQEQFQEPLNAKRAKRAEVQALMQQGQAEIARRQQELQQAKQEIAQLHAETLSALGAEEG